MSPSSSPSALGRAVSRRPPGEASLRAAGAFLRKFGGYSDKGAFCLSSYNSLMSPLKVDPNPNPTLQTRKRAVFSPHRLVWGKEGRNLDLVREEGTCGGQSSNISKAKSSLNVGQQG